MFVAQLVVASLAIDWLCKKIAAKVDIEFAAKTVTKVNIKFVVKTVVEMDMRLTMETLVEGVVLGPGMYTEMALTKQDIMVLLKVIVMGSEISYYWTIISEVYLINYPIILIFKDKYSLILYHKYF